VQNDQDRIVQMAKTLLHNLGYFVLHPYFQDQDKAVELLLKAFHKVGGKGPSKAHDHMLQSGIISVSSPTENPLEQKEQIRPSATATTGNTSDSDDELAISTVSRVTENDVSVKRHRVLSVEDDAD